MEHEVARCAAPLMFSFTDRDANPMLVARVGRNLHPESRAQVRKDIFQFALYIGLRNFCKSAYNLQFFRKLWLHYNLMFDECAQQEAKCV